MSTGVATKGKTSRRPRVLGILLAAVSVASVGAQATRPVPPPARNATSQPVAPAPRVRPQTERVALDLCVTGVPPADADIYAALRRTLPEFAARDVPIADALREWQKRLGVNVHVQVRLLEDAGVELDQPVTVMLRNVTAERVLQLLTQEVADGHAMGYDVLDGVLVVSTSDTLARELVTRTYAVSDLTGSSPAATESPEDDAANDRAQRLIAILCGLIEPDTWMWNGGTASVEHFRGSLIVSHTPSVHERIVSLLHALRTVSRGASVWVIRGGEADPAADDAVWIALRRVLPSVSYDDVPLRRVIDDLRQRLGVNLHLLHSNLRNVGLDLDTPVRLHLERVTGERVLQQILSDLQWVASVGFDVDGGIVIIATRDHHDRSHTTRVYNVGDVVPGRGVAALAARERLLDLITGTIESDTWNANGGTASLQGIGDMLVVGQSRRAHRKIEDLLKQLRQQGLPASMPARP